MVGLLLNHSNSCRQTYTHTYIHIHKKSVFWVCRWSWPGDSSACWTQPQRVSSPFLFQFVHCKQERGFGWWWWGLQPEANTGRYRPGSASFIFASPAPFACNSNRYRLFSTVNIVLCDRVVKVAGKFEDPSQGGQRTGKTHTHKKKESSIGGRYKCGFKTGLE